MLHDIFILAVTPDDCLILLLILLLPSSRHESTRHPERGGVWGPGVLVGRVCRAWVRPSSRFKRGIVAGDSLRRFILKKAAKRSHWSPRGSAPGRSVRQMKSDAGSSPGILGRVSS